MKINLDKNIKNIFLIIIRDLFLAAFFLFVVFTVLEIVKPKIILNYLNLDIYFFVMLGLGLITIFYCEAEVKEIKELKFLDYSTIILFSVLTGFFCFYLARSIGWLSILVGTVGAVICYLFINSTKYE